MDIDNKLVVVTGASSGIGEAISKAISEAGAATIVLLARREENLKKTTLDLQAKGKNAIYFPVDLSSASAIASVSKQIISDFGVPDILINNARQKAVEISSRHLSS